MAWVLFLNAITLLLLNLQLHYLPYHTPQVKNQAAATRVTLGGKEIGAEHQQRKSYNLRNDGEDGSEDWCGTPTKAKTQVILSEDLRQKVISCFPKSAKKTFISFPSLMSNKGEEDICEECQ